ncbi:MAG: barstar family protein [Lachnospiraceae bacterium]|nr:barstar family protein [Lachnospiraceae bacterium]
MQASDSSTKADRVRVFYIDLQEAASPAEVQESIASALPLPAHYGRNLDALYDVLTEYGCGWDLIFYHDALLSRSQPKYYETLKRLCREAAEDTPGLRVRFFRG